MRKHSTIVTLDKNILRHYCRAEKEKGQENTLSNRKRIIDRVGISGLNEKFRARDFPGISIT